MSTQTANIGLHQWESTDNFLREDFNEDNRKIDQAIQQATDKSAQAVEQLSTRLDTEVGQISDRLDTEVEQVTTKLNTEIGKLSTALDTEIRQVSDRLEEAVGDLQQSVNSFRVSGSYTITPGTPVSVRLGFRPSLLFIMMSRSDGLSIATCTAGLCLVFFYNKPYNNGNMSIMQNPFTNEGFQIQGNDFYLNYGTDATGYYIAFR